VWQRFLIVLAGPATNFLIALLLLMGIFAAAGYPSTPPIVGQVLPDTAAARAGFAPGDRIVAIDGRAIGNYAELKTYVAIRPDQDMVFSVARDGERVTLRARPRAETARDQFGNEARIGLLGVAPAGTLELKPLPVSQLPGTALRSTVDTVEMMVTTLGQVITGRRSVQELGGPLKIAEVSGQQASLGWLPFFWLVAVVSINLGFINLLPIPMLDGGHLLFYLIEGVRRRPLKPEAQEWAFRAGLTVLLMLMIFVTLNDLASFGLFTRLGGLIG